MTAGDIQKNVVFNPDGTPKTTTRPHDNTGGMVREFEHNALGQTTAIKKYFNLESWFGPTGGNIMVEGAPNFHGWGGSSARYYDAFAREHGIDVVIHGENGAVHYVTRGTSPSSSRLDDAHTLEEGSL